MEKFLTTRGFGLSVDYCIEKKVNRIWFQYCIGKKWIDFIIREKTELNFGSNSLLSKLIEFRINYSKTWNPESIFLFEIGIQSEFIWFFFSDNIQIEKSHEANKFGGKKKNHFIRKIDLQGNFFKKNRLIFPPWNSTLHTIFSKIG